MTPKEVLEKWIDCFNASDVEGIAALYADDAVNIRWRTLPWLEKKPYAGCLPGSSQRLKWFVLLKIFLKMENGLYWNGKTHWGCVVAASSISKTILLYIRGATGTNLVS